MSVPPSPHPDDYPRSMRDPEVRDRRRSMLRLAHVLPLTNYVAELRKRGGEVPEFDPLDGGVNAKALFLFEKPGPMTADAGRSKQAGSGFISRNNDDPTAEATFRFMQLAAIPRELTVTWNVIPWWNGTINVTKSELQNGIQETKVLLRLLPNLQAVIFVGSKAAAARAHFEGAQLLVFSSAHPSPRVRALFPEKWNTIPLEWRKVGEALK